MRYAIWHIKHQSNFVLWGIPFWNYIGIENFWKDFKHPHFHIFTAIPILHDDLLFLERERERRDVVVVLFK